MFAEKASDLQGKAREDTREDTGEVVSPVELAGEGKVREAEAPGGVEGWWTDDSEAPTRQEV
jgi:hypothetical protein